MQGREPVHISKDEKLPNPESGTDRSTSPAYRDKPRSIPQAVKPRALRNSASLAQAPRQEWRGCAGGNDGKATEPARGTNADETQLKKLRQFVVQMLRFFAARTDLLGGASAAD
jgi:hypothetical protein